MEAVYETYKKGQVGLDTTKIFILVLLALGVLGFVMIVIFANLSDASTNIFATTTTTTNETVESILLKNGSSHEVNDSFGDLSTVTTPTQAYLDFDGEGTIDDSYVNVTGLFNSPIFANSFSVSFWAQIHMIEVLDFDILGNEDRSRLQQGFAMSYLLEDIFSFGFNNGSDTVFVDTQILEFNRWYNVVGRYNGTNIEIYLDGVFQEIRNITGSAQNLQKFAIGCHICAASLTEPDGFVDEVRIYNRTLTDSEILEINESGRFANSSLPSDEMFLWYSFNENNGSTSIDKSTLSNNGTYIDGVIYGAEGTTSLEVNVDYTLTTGGFPAVTDLNLINDVWEWSLINLTYSNTTTTGSNDPGLTQSQSIFNNISVGIEEFFSNATVWFSLLAVVVIILIISIVVIVVNRIDSKNKVL